MTALPKISGEKLWDSIETMGQIGRTEAGRTRLSFGKDDIEARRMLVRWMEELGMSVHTDAYANIWGVRPGREGTERPVAIGSHIDTVREAGMFDGVMGVLSGLAVIRAMNEAGIVTNRPVAVVSFSDEEGGRFLAGAMAGSSLMAGVLTMDDIGGYTDEGGTTWRSALAGSGFAGEDRLKPHAYLEYHIEQGPVLEAEGIEIGVVKGVVGLSWIRATFRGEANHAGAFPMHMRRDAGLAAANAAIELNRLAFELGQGTVVTTGQAALRPNVPNIVPGEAVITVDIRQFDPGIFEKGIERVHEILKDSAKKQGVACEIETMARAERAAFPEEMVSLVERKANELGYSAKRMQSGAGHDAQIMNLICPTGMIFVPSAGGRSHCPEEYTSPEDVAKGANVLLNCVLELAGAE